MTAAASTRPSPTNNAPIAHLSMARGYRGGERQAELLMAGLHAAGVAQRAVVRAGEPLAERVHAFGLSDVRQIRGSLLSAARACRGCALVHAHDGRSVHAAALARRLFGVPYIITRRVDNPLKRRFLTRHSYTSAATVVALSSAIEAQVAALDRRIHCARIADASTGFEIDADNVARLRKEFGGRYVVGHAGALDHSHKGQRDIVSAARLLADIHPDVVFVLLGSGVDEAALREQAADLTNVQLRGHVHNMGDYLALFDAFVFPSLHEGMGSVLLDAMAFGLPIVATRVGGIVDLIDHDDNGLLISPSTPRELAAAVARLRDEPQLAQRLGERGRERAQDYTPARMVERYLDLYRALGVSTVAPDTL